MINPAKVQALLQQLPDNQLMEMLKRPDKIPSMFVQQELKRIDSIFSLYDENSTISKVNSGAWPSWTFYPGQEDYEKLSDISKRIKELQKKIKF